MRSGLASHGVLSLRPLRSLRLKHQSLLGSFSVERGNAFYTFYNELIRRGYNVDVGVVEHFGKVDGKTVKRQYERVHRKDHADGLRLLQEGI